MFKNIITLKDLLGPHRSNRWNKSSHSCLQIGSEVAGKPPPNSLISKLDLYTKHFFVGRQSCLVVGVSA
ncbi:unnamed protein product [Hymenolepis diminuta]|uniref:Uncharacterized protein n=1 Tax=Hymenolepis diminuta TaxID=6216 RepID=A0A564ZBN8_HYMDI|nr:unnamed protein product [Hymenolepis diminuta]